MNNETLIRLALAEDIGSGDVTTEALIESDRKGAGIVMAKESLVVAGLGVAQAVFTTLDPDMGFESTVQDGDSVQAGDEIFIARGRLKALLLGERTALNFLQRLSGIATLTRRYADEVADAGVRLTDTRKTTPGWRRLEKQAVKAGGGHNHRFGLDDGILIKDNHIVACGGIKAAVAKARAAAHHLLKIEVEVGDLDEVNEALQCGAEVIMLDNMSLEEIRRAVGLVANRALVEISGGVTLDQLSDLVDAGVDIISAGALTHSARAVDISMRVAV
jgi:nicotinate-nucleotide pyrophosphorylase (carboxylating)